MIRATELLAGLDAWATRYPWVTTLGVVLGAGLAGLVVQAVAHHVLARLARRSVMAERLVHYTRRPAQLLIPLLFMQSALGEGDMHLPRVERWLAIGSIVLITSLAVRFIQAAADVVQARYPLDAVDNLRARGVRTQTRVLSRTAMFLVALLGVASVLMTFPSVRQFGTSLLASAGVAGIVAGLAARPVLGNLIAGMQIAITQPIRLDDVLIVENEWGRVEEITATYVVVRIWDDRRLVVPLEYFINTPFQNWTRHTSDLIGSAFFWVDYAMPIPPLREALHSICEAAPEWDKRVCVLQVTDCSAQAMQLRALVSTQDAGSGWDLRCRVREELLAYMQANYPQYLPKTRNQLFEEPAAVRAKPDRTSVDATPHIAHIADTGSAPAAVADGVATP